MSKELTTTNTFALDYNDKELLKTLRNTVALGATDDEFKMFTLFCQSTGLNPLKKEIWFIKLKDGRIQMMTGINGYLAIANSHPQFDGMECELEIDQKTGHLIQATAKAYRKDRKFPSVGIALMKESRGNSPIWNSQPSVMLSKVAKARALREAFAQEMGGLYTDDEMPEQYSSEAVNVTPEAPKPAPKATKQPEIVDADPGEPHIYYLKNNTPQRIERMTHLGARLEPDGLWYSDHDLGPDLDKAKIHNQQQLDDARSFIAHQKKLEAKAKTIQAEIEERVGE